MSRDNWKRIAKRSLRWVLAAVVLAGVGWNVRKTWADLQAKGESIQIQPGWIVLAGLLYLAGLVLCGAFYGRILRSSPTPIAAPLAVRAYVISHLGKYVPGKAMVVVMRVALSTPFGARGATAAIATFYETLVMMGAGAALAALGFGLSQPFQLDPLLVSLGLGSGLLVVVDPKVFPRVSRLFTSPIPGVGPEASPHYSRRLLIEGLLLAGAGWILFGLSQVAVVQAFAPGAMPPSQWPLAAAGVALGTVAGFVVAVLPGGLGVREWVLMLTLKPALGLDRAVIAAILLRLTWVAAELVAGLVLTAWRPATSAVLVQAGQAGAPASLAEPIDT